MVPVFKTCFLFSQCWELTTWRLDGKYRWRDLFATCYITLFWRSSLHEYIVLQNKICIVMQFLLSLIYFLEDDVSLQVMGKSSFTDPRRQGILILCRSHFCTKQNHTTPDVRWCQREFLSNIKIILMACLSDVGSTKVLILLCGMIIWLNWAKKHMSSVTKVPQTWYGLMTYWSTTDLATRYFNSRSTSRSLFLVWQVITLSIAIFCHMSTGSLLFSDLE